MKLVQESSSTGYLNGTAAGRSLGALWASLRGRLVQSKQEWQWFLGIMAVFLLLFYLPLGNQRFDNAVMESLYLAQEYAQQHVLLCLVPAFFIAGAIAVFVSQASVIKYMGANAPKVLAYGVASTSGVILAVCSCTVLPLFAGIYRMGAGLGPAIAFLYSGPAINVLAITLTASVLGAEMGLARAIGAISFSVIIGVLMHLLFIKEERAKVKVQAMLPEPQVTRPLWQNGLYFAAMVAILVFANWGKPQESGTLWAAIYDARWLVTGLAGIGFGLVLGLWFGVRWAEIITVGLFVLLAALIAPQTPLIPFVVGVIGLAVLINRERSSDELQNWSRQSWGFAKQIMPLLFFGVLISGLLLGRPGHEGLIPSEWVIWAVGGNSLLYNFVASFVGAFMYFATLTEVPILQGLIGNGMGKGPALALLLAGPALSLPNMLVIRSVLGTTKTVVYVSLVVVMATLTGMLYGTFFG